MAFSNVYRMNVDIKRRLTSVVPTFKQGDNGVLKFKIYDDGRLFDLSNYTYSEITFRLPNGEPLVGNPELINGELVYNFTGTEMSVAGKVETVLSIMSGNTMVSLQPFMCFIFDSMKGENLSYIGILQELIKETQNQGLSVEATILQVQDLIGITDEALIEINQALQEEDSRRQNESIRVNAESTRIDNEDERVIKENARISNEQARQSNETQRQNRFLARVEEFDTMMDDLDEVKTLPYHHLTTFKPPNFVAYDGSTYAVLKTVTGVTPSNDGVNYRMAAQRGVDGNGAVNTVNGVSPNLDGNVEIDLTFQEFIDHERNETNQMHIETVTSIPTNLANSGIIVKVDGANPTTPETPTLDQFEDDVREILDGFSDEIQSVQTELTQHKAQNDIHVTTSEKNNWNAKSNFSGSYTDLTNKPTIPTLNNTVTSTSTTQAATANAVRLAYELAQSAKMDGNNVKSDVVAALLALDSNLAITSSNTWEEIELAIASINTGVKHKRAIVGTINQQDTIAINNVGFIPKKIILSFSTQPNIPTYGSSLSNYVVDASSPTAGWRQVYNSAQVVVLDAPTIESFIIQNLGSSTVYNVIYDAYE